MMIMLITGIRIPSDLMVPSYRRILCCSYKYGQWLRTLPFAYRGWEVRFLIWGNRQAALYAHD